jgi:hypothetical protein
MTLQIEMIGARCSAVNAVKAVVMRFFDRINRIDGIMIFSLAGRMSARELIRLGRGRFSATHMEGGSRSFPFTG